MTSEHRLEIVFAPETARQVSNYVVRGFFSLGELPQALTRMLLTREFGIFVGVPLLLILAAHTLPGKLAGQDSFTLSQVLNGTAAFWLLAGLVRISRYGHSSGIGCFALDAEGTCGALLGGLRLRLQRSSRKLWIAGLLVAPEARGAGISTALVLAAFRLAQQESEHGPLTVSVFAPSHPASKAITAHQLGGMQTIEITHPPSEEVRQTIERLEAALARSTVASFDFHLNCPEQGLFAR
jgi:GNAT superfamily N-acetyltransferase